MKLPLLLLRTFLLLLTLPLSLLAQSVQKVDGWVEQGDYITTQGINSTTKGKRVFPLGTVTVYATGTTTLSTIYSDSALTAKANPFTADSNGYFSFWAAPGTYDIKFSATGLTTWTRTIQIPGTTSSGGIIDKGGQVFDVRAYGAVCDGSTDDSAALASALASAIAVNGTVLIPAATCIGQIAAVDNMNLRGVAKNASIIKWTGNAPVLNVATTCNQCQISDLTFQGSVSAGSSNIGIKLGGNGSTYGQVFIENVYVRDTGGQGIYSTDAFSAKLKAIDVDNTNGYPIDINATQRPAFEIEDTYVHSLRAAAPAGYRIRGGTVVCRNCNGIDGTLTGSKWAVVGKKAGTDGDVATAGAVFVCDHCNLESWVANGILAYGASTLMLRNGTTFIMNGAGAGTGKPIQYDNTGDGTDFFSQYARRGLLEDSVLIENPLSDYANSQAVHANGFAPLELESQGAGLPSNTLLTSWYNSSTSTAVPLPRRGRATARLTVTGTTSIAQPGVSFIEANCSAPCTITLPWAGWYLAGQPVTIKDISGSAATNNITVTAATGGTVNGSNVVMNENGQSITVTPNNIVNDWRLVGVSYSNGVATRVAIWDSAAGMGNVSGLTWDAGTASLNATRFYSGAGSAGAPSHSFTSASNKGFYDSGSNEIGIAISGGNNFTFGAGYFDLKEVAAPSASASGYTRIYSDSTAHRLKVSNNTGSFSNILLSTDWATPGAIGTTTPAAGTFTTLTASASLTINGGTPVLKILSTTATLDFPSVSAQSSSDLTITLTGAAAGDAIFLSIPAAQNAHSCFTAWVSAANTVTVRFNNYSSGSIDPASGTYRVALVKF